MQHTYKLFALWGSAYYRQRQLTDTQSLHDGIANGKAVVDT